MAQHEREHEEGDIGAALAPERVHVQPPRPYQVILLNDDFTPMEFVVDILVGIFAHSPGKAMNVMLAIHQQGRGVAGVYTRDIAQTKVEQVHALARQNEHPLRCIMESA